MKTKSLVALALALILAMSVVGPATAGKKKKGPKAGPLVVGTDAEGDWGAAVAPELAPLGDATGQDLIEARIEPGEDKANINFVIKVTSLPPSGGVPEFVRYVWDMHVDGEFVELDGKFTNYSRGACDPTSGQCPPPRDPGLYPFIIRGECEIANDTGSSVTVCKELGVVEAIFDAAKGEITVPVPAELIHAKPGSKITGGPNIFGGSVSASPAAFLSTTAFPLDNLVVLETYVVSKK